MNIYVIKKEHELINKIALLNSSKLFVVSMHDLMLNLLQSANNFYIDNWSPNPK